MKFEDLDQDSQERMIKHWKQFGDESAKGFVKTYQEIYNEQYEKLRKTITADGLVLLAIALDTTPSLLAGWYDIDFPEEDE